MQNKPLLQGREGPNPTEWALIIDDQRFTPANRLILDGYHDFIADCFSSCCSWFGVMPSDWYGLIGLADRPYDRAKAGKAVISALPDQATYQDFAKCLSEHLEVALYYIYSSLGALSENNVSESVSLFSCAITAHTTFKNFCEVIQAELGESPNQKVDMREAGKKGGSARAEKYKKLEEIAVAMYEAGNYKSMRQAALKITPDLFDKARTLGISLSESNAERTAYDWIRKSK
ncbi:hypothetical protein [Ferribacterium limneticum]|uniref:hypothetical protein n=1 Tax=Ferribacterium limneticum TaxID=76259 RepID=UPI001CFB85CD|nr:hypothetical protein [Ferribacterium limneticum]UCV29384.1 hypothetical protein KI617_04605 [Ferribacterium limneticum]UCV33303.1 hypothetical protein KI608_04605 [Ferribacterium limneticum]